MDKNFFKKCLLFSLSLLLTFCIGFFIFTTFSKIIFLKELFIKTFEIFKPILYVILIAYILRPVCNFYNNKFLNLFSKTKIKKKETFSLTLSIICSLLTLIITIALLLNLVIPQLLQSIPTATQQIIDKTKEVIN